MKKIKPRPFSSKQEDRKNDIVDKIVSLTTKIDSLLQFEEAWKNDASEGKNILNSLSDKYEKLSKLYDLMTEYKKTGSLMVLKLADAYERVVLLKLFCESSFSDESEENTVLRKKVNGLEGMLKRTLNSFGLVPIFPLRNSECDPEQHEIMTTRDPEYESDLPGHIAECLKMGIIQNGVTIKYAQVAVFKTAEEENF